MSSKENLNLPEIPDIFGVDPSSIAFRIYMLVNVINEDGWFIEGDEATIHLDGGVCISAQNEEIDDAQIFLDNYDEMKLYKARDLNQVEFSSTYKIIEHLNKIGNMHQFHYEFLFDGEGGLQGTVVVRNMQAGDGVDCGADVKFSSEIDRSLLDTWVQALEK